MTQFSFTIGFRRLALPRLRAGLWPGEALSGLEHYANSCMAPKVFVVMIGTDALVQVIRQGPRLYLMLLLDDAPFAPAAARRNDCISICSILQMGRARESQEVT